MRTTKSTAVCILGMHRSGTSVFTRTLNLLGAYLGEDHDLMPATEDNPEGYWEHTGIVTTHNKILDILQSRWDTAFPLPSGWTKLPEIDECKKELIEIVDKSFIDKPLWAWKDPRTCLLLPLWQEIALELEFEIKYLICMRNPNEVSLSLQKRDGFSEEKSLGIWYNYTLSSLYWTSSCSRTVVQYESFLEHWKEDLETITNGLDIIWPCDEVTAHARISQFIKPGLRRNKSLDNKLERNEHLHSIKEVYNACKEIDGNDLGSASFNLYISKLYLNYLSTSQLLSDDATNTFLQVFWETDNKTFNEASSIKRNIQANGRFNEYTLYFPKGVQGNLRIDPSGVSCFIDILSIDVEFNNGAFRISSSNNFVNLSVDKLNSQSIAIDDCYSIASMSDDPQIFVSIPEAAKLQEIISIKIVYRIATIVESKYAQLLADVNRGHLKTVDEKDQTILLVKKQVAERQAEVDKHKEISEQYIIQNSRMNEQIKILNDNNVKFRENIVNNIEEIKRLQLTIVDLSEEIQQLNRKIEQREEKIGRYRMEVADMTSTLSWKLGRPLRAIERFIRRRAKNR
ncbi:sulfotransferase family protein [Cohnella yongneupensis]|uniref:Sulfotransferase family protein n=1 Tax=Cohnella yongneupensis TaxID=425006 RepID=A0ABW0R1Z0_9BACL